MMMSVYINIGVMIVLQNFNKINVEMDQIQNCINIGLKIVGVKDNVVIYVVVQSMCVDVSVLGVVQIGLECVSIIGDVVLVVGEVIFDFFVQMCEKVVVVMDFLFDIFFCVVYDSDFKVFVDQV